MGFSVGTSGWQYRDWRGRFYPARAPATSWLSLYAARFPIVEVNATFYRLPERSTFQHWRDATEATRLRFVLKCSRYLTHIRRLVAPQEPVDRLLDRAEPLGDRLVAVLVQLPPGLRADPALLDGVLEAFAGRGVQVAFEPRDPSWLDGEPLAVLRRRNAALVWTDRRGRIGALDQTASWGYVRFHEGRSRDGAYGAAALSTWAARLDAAWPAPTAEVMAFFNNDHAAAAPANALMLARRLRALGRVAPTGQAPAGDRSER
jgi:uncharacterized protein YecE (DUF72 family)